MSANIGADGCRYTLVLVATVMEKLAFLGPFRDAQNVRAEPKEGIVLKWY